MITINTERIDQLVEAKKLELKKVENFRHERVSILVESQELLTDFMEYIKCRDLDIQNMYSTGSFEHHTDDCSLIYHCMMKYKKDKPKNKKLFITKLKESFEKIVSSLENRLSLNIQEYQATDTVVKFEILINK